MVIFYSYLKNPEWFNSGWIKLDLRTGIIRVREQYSLILETIVLWSGFLIAKKHLAIDGRFNNQYRNKDKVTNGITNDYQLSPPFLILSHIAYLPYITNKSTISRLNLSD